MSRKVINAGVKELKERIIATKVDQLGGKTIVTWVE
jgi:hypothetical protein